MKLLRYLCLVLLSASPAYSMQSLDFETVAQMVKGSVGEMLRDFYDTYYSKTKTTAEVAKAVTENLEKTYLGTLPFEIRREIVNHAAADEFIQLFYRLDPIRASFVQIYPSFIITPPDFDYVHYLLQLGVNPNVMITENKTALNILDAFLKHRSQYERERSDFLKKFVALQELIKEYGGKNFSELE